MGDSNPAATFGHVAREAGKRRLAFICARESLDEPRQGPMIKKTFTNKGPMGKLTEHE